MHQYRNLLFLLVATVFFLSTSAPKKTIRILALGDSITQGGNKERDEYSYRLPLQMILHQKGIAFDFIGSQQKGLNDEFSWPDVAKGLPFDPDHDGYYGNTTADACRKAMEGYEAYQIPPDLILIHLGTNDQEGGSFEQNIEQPLREIITFMRTKNPNVMVLLGHLNFNDNDNALKIRKIVAHLSIEMNNDSSIVQTVHHYKGWIENPDAMYTDTFDWAHPNLKGQEKMAYNWWEAMEKHVYRLD